MKPRRCLSLLLALLIVLPLAALPARAEKSSGVIRVLLTKLSLTDRVEIALDGSYTVQGLSFQRGSHVVAALADQSIFVYYEGLAFDAGQQVTFTRHAVTDGQENGFRVNGAYELHPGDLQLSIQNGQLQAILYAPVEEYLLGVVPYEMSDSFPLEALKAQAVAARTYALRRAVNSQKKDYDVVDNTNDQVYLGVKKENARAAQAVRETAGQCGYYKGALAECFYTASNGGQTEIPLHVWGRGDYGYLAMTDDPYDLENPESTVKSFAFPKSLSDNDHLGPLKETIMSILSETVEAMGYDGDMAHIRVTGILDAKVESPLYTDTPSKIMTALRLTLQAEGRRLIEEDNEEDVSMFDNPREAPSTPVPDKKEKREAWSSMQPLPSPIVISLNLFPTVEGALGLSINGGSNEIMTIRENDTAFILEARRYGHGVGMSQRGAQVMAENHRWTYDQILKFYYPGMTVSPMDYTFTLPTALAARFLATPGPAATPTPRPTLMPVRSTPGPGQSLVTVTNIGATSYLNLRAEPNTQAAVLRQLYYGQALIVTQDQGEWLKVRTDDAEGYVMAQFVTRITPTPAP
ncbi:MAG: SpoIID/LytB domain-containing protein [Clostridia bacterium]|nr:SpoIID/LytB domain-containing protein [Clostridia bacterium]